MSMGSFSSRGVRANMRVIEVRETVLQVEGHRLSPKAKSSAKRPPGDNKATSTTSTSEFTAQDNSGRNSLYSDQCGWKQYPSFPKPTQQSYFIVVKLSYESYLN